MGCVRKAAAAKHCKQIFSNTMRFVSSQAMGYASSDGMLTEQMIDERVDEAVEQHKLKVDWMKQHTPETSGGGATGGGANSPKSRDIASSTLSQKDT